MRKERAIARGTFSDARMLHPARHDDVGDAGDADDPAAQDLVEGLGAPVDPLSLDVGDDVVVFAPSSCQTPRG
jgi:hypothetical protein